MSSAFPNFPLAPIEQSMHAQWMTTSDLISVQQVYHKQTTGVHCIMIIDLGMAKPHSF